jgi:predicted glycoside hydrolase/deacetylase ChbG (UPF0249 family)
MLYVNADDFGCTCEITDKILCCYRKNRIDAASAMTFMKDSERASYLAQESNLSVGLHLNFTVEFTGDTVKGNLRNQHKIVAAYLNARKFNQILYNPRLGKAFGYVFQAQWDEFCHLYGEAPRRLDGHHHMHLCMNMITSGRYPKGIKIRRNFTFNACEKDTFNRLYRYLVDRYLRSRFLCSDFFFSMAPIDKGKLERLVLLSKSSDVELMVHPGVENEYSFLLSPEWANLTKKNCAG